MAVYLAGSGKPVAPDKPTFPGLWPSVPSLRRKSVGLVLLLAALIVGCTEPSTTPAAPSSHVSPVVDEVADETARALAAAMDDSDVRRGILDAMRASPWGGHRLILSEYLESREGAALRALMADAGGLEPAVLVRQVKELGHLEILAPYREHRMEWRGSRDVVVGVTREEEVSAWRVYSPDGTAHTLVEDEEFLEFGAFFAVRPAETFGMRIDRQPDVPGDVIQDPGDGEVATIITVQHPGEAPVVIDLGAYGSEDERRQALAEVGMVRRAAGPLLAPPNPTDVEGMQIYFADAAGDPSCEIELWARYWDPINSGGLYHTRHENIYAAGGWYNFGGIQLLPSESPSSSGNDLVDIDVRETDFWNHDDKGTRNFYWGDNGIARPIYSFSTHTIDLELSW